ncbi:uncharacterized protein LOC122062386 [Macadamia integrifolia]|uniref:uncharacterized protein LOC122062386 n=1 Tax=Macadamia integrifolia TaxID=60698 RepID=UPI001C4F09C0|nr:uncharacterized protein LOC122062386 [Macadamia integrifolia]
MGHAITKLATGREEEYKAQEIAPIIDQFYDSLFAADTTNIHNLADFYHAICQTIEEINTKLGDTQFRIPSTKTLQKVFKEQFQSKDSGVRHFFFWPNKMHLREEEHKGKESCVHLTKDEFIKILLHVIFETGITGTGAKEVLLLLFGFLSIFQEQHHSERDEKPLTKEGFRKISQRGAMDILFFIFGVPITTLFVKQRLIPTAIPNELFIPGVTSATVFFLAILKKI